MNRICALILVSVAAFLTACSTEPKSEGDKTSLAAAVQSEMVAFQTKDPSIKELLDKSVGYALFPDAGKAGLIIGGSYGRGEVFEHGRKIGYADFKQGSVGLQGGAQSFSELVIFMRQSDLDRFKSGEFSLSGNASAVALKAGAARQTDPSKGVIVFVESKGGLMAEAAIAGQVLRFKPL
jgi:lipid-binding SYLF domain-containing protein